MDQIEMDDDIEFEDIQQELQYYSYFRKAQDPRLAPPRTIFKNQNSLWALGYDDFIVRAFSEKYTTVELIDQDYPESKSCSKYSGENRTGTPVGDKAMIAPEAFSATTSTVMFPAPVSSARKCTLSPFLSEIKAFYDTISLNVSTDPQEICVAVSKDQNGSRFIQSKIDTWSPEQIGYFFSQINGSILELSMNLFGNYVVQKLIPILQEDDIFKLILQLFNQIYTLSLHTYGCRVIQKLIENLSDIKFIVAELDSHAADLIASPNGNHVIQKCIDKNVDKSFLIREFESDCLTLARERYGCRVLQRLFEACEEEETWNIYLEIIDNLETLINDKYGNYVIQHLIETPNKKKDQIYDYIVRNSPELSRNKFSSNVIEKCVNSSSEKRLGEFLEQFLKVDDEGKPKLYYMCVDMYANYVVQRFFDVAPQNLKNLAKVAIRPYMKEMRQTPFTKHILSKLV